MTGEMLSFLAGGSTPGLVKPDAYDTIEVSTIENSEIRKIAHDVWTTLPTYERLCAKTKIIYGLPVLSWLGGSWVEGRGEIHTESGGAECKNAMYRLCT